MRGALLVVDAHVLLVGIIPAYAGSTTSGEQKKVMIQDHPRVCGEHPTSSLSFLRLPGSSPRMRGAQALYHVLVGAFGIIPAYAGSTYLANSHLPPARDHPRVCGEHQTSRSLWYVSWGSSPRMRGALSRTISSTSWPRIIPAYAGSTLHEVHRSSSKCQIAYGCQGSACR